MEPGDSKADAKARRFAEKKGIDVGDAIAVGRAFVDGADQVLVVRPGGLELHRLGKVGSLTRKGAGVVTLAAGRIGSVSTRREGITGVVSIDGSGQDLEFHTDLITRDRIAAAIRQCTTGAPAPLVQAPPAASTYPPPPAVPAGWYPAGDVQRYWDGSTWTEHTAPLV